MFSVIFQQIIKMLLILLLGVLCYRVKLIDKDFNARLADLLLLVINPVVTFNALQTPYSQELVRGLLISFALAVATHLVMIGISTLAIRKKGNENFAVERLSAVYSNCGFIGIPMVKSIFGMEGVLYLSAYLTIFNILIWTHGVALMTGSSDHQKIRPSEWIRTTLINLRTPMIFACLLGIIFFFLRIRLPEIILDTMDMIGNVNTPLAMIIAGVAVAQTDLPAMLKNARLYLITALKLFVMPAITLVILMFVPVENTVKFTILIAAACPAASTVTALSLRYHKNDAYSSEIYTFSTLCCLITIPVFLTVAEQIL